MPRFKPPPMTLRTPAVPRPEPTGAHDAPSFTIGELAREFGLSLRTLRFYESKGMLQPERRGLTRIYAPADRARLAVILEGKALGLSLREIRETLAREDAAAHGDTLRLSQDEIARKIAALEAQKREIERALAGLRGQRGGSAGRGRHKAA